ncbi:putative methyltransferase-domain-containing protein [Chytridium lagenaria]|nr:putative methyltransferase-domain-containing protein [Chytridium lagenaria]
MRKRRPRSLVEPTPRSKPSTHRTIPSHRTQKIISTYHALNKRLSLCLKQNDEAGATLIHTQMAAIGKGACGKWLVPILKKEGLVDGGERVRLLDVGAVNGETYARQRGWMEVTDGERFHVLCLSLVVNFVGEPERRGEMLRRTHQFLLPNGLLYLVLPLPCVTNSRYLTHDRLTKIMTSLRFQETHHHFSTKLAHFIYRRRDNGEEREWKKEEVNPGAGRNNFTIVVKKT